MESETFKNLAEGIQSIIIVVGLIAGGIWTFRNFNLLHARKIAQSQLKELEKRLEEWGEIETEVIARQIESVNANEFLIVASVEFKNTGTREVRLDFSKRPCSISEVIFDNSGQPRLENPIHCNFIAPAPFADDQSDRMLHSAVIEPKGILKTSSAFRITNPGLYLVGCSIKTPTSDKGQLSDPSWAGFTYILVN